MYVGATLLDMRALTKAAENFVLLFSVPKAKMGKNLVGGTEF